MGERMNFTVCFPCGIGSIPSHSGVFQWIFPWLITLCQPDLSQRGRKRLNPPQWYHPSCEQREQRLKSHHGQTMAKIKKNSVV